MRARAFMRQAWRLAVPYWSSEDRVAAWGLLVAVIALDLGSVAINVILSNWQNGFYNTFEDRDWDGFIAALWLFTLYATLWIIVTVYQTYLSQMLQIRWRRWLTHRMLDQWLERRAFYRLQLFDTGTDNPDQRLAEDIRMFVQQTLSLGLGLLNAVANLLSFLGILWGLSGAVTLWGVEIPGYMVWVALIYAAIGTWIAHLIGRKLVTLNFFQQRREADFRYHLVRVRENAEQVALYGGERAERRGLDIRFAALVDNFIAIMKRQKLLSWYTSGYGQVAIIFPYVVASPRFFTGQIRLGDLTQTATAFGQVQSSLSYLIDSYTAIAEWRAVVDRLIGFQAAMTTLDDRLDGAAQVHVSDDDRSDLALDGLDLRLPDGRVLLTGANASIAPGQQVLLTGPSGSGKSTLLRAAAGLWPFGAGRIRRPAAARLMFLPQRPYVPLGTLRDAVTYPAPGGETDDVQIAAMLHTVGLDHLVTHLDEEARWGERLSLGEQQRLGFARALLAKPDWIFLDEATSSLDTDAETKMYGLLKQHLPNATVLSIGHRPSLEALHGNRWRLAPGATGATLVTT